MVCVVEEEDGGIPRLSPNELWMMVCLFFSGVLSVVLMNVAPLVLWGIMFAIMFLCICDCAQFCFLRDEGDNNFNEHWAEEQWLEADPQADPNSKEEDMEMCSKEENQLVLPS